jgi:hypothetical protein
MKKLLFLLAFGILSLLVPAGPVFAATTLFIEGPTTVRPDTDVTYALRASLTDAINAVGLTVAFDPASVTNMRFSAADSVIREWLDRSLASSSLRLEGIIPGGTAPVFTDTVPLGYLTMRFTREGRTKLAIRDPEVYLHQPEPILDASAVSPLTVTVKADASGTSDTPPTAHEEVYVTVFRTPGFLDGAWSIAYDIRTPAGPVARVMLRERLLGLFGRWREISSPASLSDQSRLSILEAGIPGDGDVRIVYREVPVRLIILASLLGIAALAYAGYRRMKH